MDWLPDAGHFWKGLSDRIHISAGAYIMTAVWLLLVPVRWMFAALFAAAVHEIGHLTAVWALEGCIQTVEIRGFGARIATSPMTPGEELVCVLAGPAAGALLCLFWKWIPSAAICAAVQTVFNLLPFYPLDGGRIWRICTSAIRRRKRSCK